MLGSSVSCSMVGQVVLEDRVAQPHRGFRRRRAEREVLRHALHEPERRRHRRDDLHVRAGLAVGEDVELELVHHFVREDVLRLLQRPLQEQHVPLAEEVGDTLGALAHLGGVGLPEIGGGGVQDDGLPLGELVVQDAGEPGI